MEEDFEATTAGFLSWLENNGVRMNPKMKLVDLRSEGRGRGVVAVEAFEEDEVVFSIPRSTVLNTETAITQDESSSSSSSSNAQALGDMPSWLALTAIMISEGAKKDSRWSKYFEVLPRHLDSLVFWTDAELAELQASAVVHKISKSHAEEMFSQHITPLGLGGCNFDLCHRVASTIMAYAFDIPDRHAENTGNGEEDGDDLVSDHGEDEKTILSMIPLADMLNADGDRNNARLCCDNEDLEMRTIKPISAGEEIFNDYGQLPQSDLLRRYGYTSDLYQDYDVVEVSTELIVSSFRSGRVLPELQQLSAKEIEKRVELAQREDIYEDSYDLVHADHDGPSIPDELLALVYLLLVDDENLASISSSQTSLPNRSKLATDLVGRVLKTLLRSREREYVTTLEEDNELLQAGNVTPRTLMAIKVRLGEKKVLREAIQEASRFEGSNKHMRIPKTAEGKRVAEEPLRPKKKGRHR